MNFTRQQWVWMIGTALLSSAVWAQSDTDLPALPPGMEAPPVQLPSAEPQQQTPAPQAKIQTNTAPEVTVSAPQETPAQTTNDPSQQQVLETFEPSTTPAPAVVDASQPVGNQPELKEDFKPSYGEFQQSLLYSPEDIERMKKVLFMYERVKRPEGVVQQAQDDFSKLVGEPVIVPSVMEPTEYPSFYLSSIVYRSPRDWLFWMNGTKYTPKVLPGGISVLGISPRSITVTWSPEYMTQAQARYEREVYDTSIPKHFKARISSVRLDKEKGYFVATIAPNQTFVSGAFGIYEGKYKDRTMPEMQQAAQVDAILNEAPSVPAGELRDPDADLKATMGQLQRMTGNLSQLAPRNNPNASGDAAETQSTMPSNPSAAAGTAATLPPAMPAMAPSITAAHREPPPPEEPAPPTQ